MARLKFKIIVFSLPWLLFLIIDLIKKPKIDFSSDLFLFYYLPGYFIWIIITPLLYQIFLWSSKFVLGQRVLFLAILGPLFALMKVSVNRLTYYVLENYSEYFETTFNPSIVAGRMSFYYVEATIITWVVLIVFYGIEVSSKFRDKSIEAAKLASDLAQANLQALKMQIHPHFLFNSHNTIVTMMRSNQHDLALEMLMKLSDLLRLSLNNFEKQLISLKQELCFITKYLAIEKIRFEDRLIVEFQTDIEVQNCLIPVFILQPLVENSIKHGVSKNLGKSILKISASRNKSHLILSVFNTGELDSNETENLKIGLSNVKDRLKNIYKESASFSLKMVENGVEATICIPTEK